VLNEYTELADLDLTHNPKIYMKPCKYDEKSARAHIKRVISLLETPCVLTNNMRQAPTARKEAKSGARSRSNSQASAEESKEKPSQYEPDEKLKQNYESFMQVIKSQQSKNVPIQTPSDSKAQQALHIFKELFSGAISQSNLKKLKHVKCVESIQFSQHHCVSESRKVQGDIFYLSVRTLENPQYEHSITCTVNGFFRNDSTATTFSPAPATKQSPCFSYSLAGCINQISPLFGRNIETYFNSILATEPYFLTPVTQPTHSWIEEAQDSATKVTVSTADGLG